MPMDLEHVVSFNSATIIMENCFFLPDNRGALTWNEVNNFCLEQAPQFHLSLSCPG